MVQPMKTLRLNANIPQDIELAAELLKQGKLVAVPTETVYGLAADASNPDAVAKIFTAKNRPADHPLITHISSLEQLPNWASEIPPVAYELAAKFWPGPLTMLFNKQEKVSGVVTGGLCSIGIRIPKQPILLQLLKTAEVAVAAPSANPYQKLSPTSAEQVAAGLDGKIDAILDAGPCSVGLESTIIKITDDSCSILRSGPITAADLQPFFNQPVSQPEQHSVAVSGNKRQHYQPNAKVRVISREELLQSEPDNKVGLLTYSLNANTKFNLGQFSAVKTMSKQKAEYARELYRALYEMEQAAVDEIWVEHPPKSNDWLDVMDRLSRAQSN